MRSTGKIARLIPKTRELKDNHGRDPARGGFYSKVNPENKGTERQTWAVRPSSGPQADSKVNPENKGTERGNSGGRDFLIRHI